MKNAEVEMGFGMAGRRALVTGGSTGIGAAICARLADAGARVVAVSRSGVTPPFEPTGGGGEVVGVAVDLTDPAQLDGLVDRAAEVFGGLDTLVNNAGSGEWRPVADLDRPYFDAMIGLNLWAPLRLCQLAHPLLAAADEAAVVMIGSVDAVRPSAGGAVYGATKAGLGAATVALAKEWRADGIRVTQVDPGLIDTPLAAEAVSALAASGTKVNLTGRAGQPDEVAALVHYLVSPAGRFANGSSFRLDGGAVALGPFDALSDPD